LKYRSAVVCTCTDRTHDEVRDAIVQGGPRPIYALMRELAWRTPDGCEKCRAALNYYFISIFPETYDDDVGARTVNERVHANVQRDGTYSVVPRVFGGVITPAQLRTIADVAERFAIPTLKITGAQRIDLLGIPEESLPEVFAALREGGFVSGHAYARGVRTVKTCVGDDWCRFGLADSMSLGIAIEEMTWSSWTPHKVKMGVSACARNCAEATIKDFGLVMTDGGWDVYVGGSAGLTVRPGQKLARGKSERETIELVAAFLQLYREEGHYGERTGRFVDRVGLDYVRARVVADAFDRSALFDRFFKSQRASQSDPWAKAAVPSGFVPASRLARERPS
jgi:nitrite reductase (NADH) large subunit